MRQANVTATEEELARLFDALVWLHDYSKDFPGLVRSVVAFTQAVENGQGTDVVYERLGRSLASAAAKIGGRNE